MNTPHIPQPPKPSNTMPKTGALNRAKSSIPKTPTELADKYTFIQELGRGTQGHVYKAIRKSDNKFVAIKQLRIDSIQTWKEYDLFMREAETLKAINIPGVVKFEEALQFLDIEHPAAYIVQEYIHGRSLGEMMRVNYRFSTQQIFRFAIKLLTILKELHHHDPPIIHRDIKPSNILFKPQLAGDGFDLYLIDFGAVANPQIQSGGSTVAGTFGYMPPEQLMGKPCPASDIYALGATLAYMLSGVEPGSMQVSDFRLVIDPHLENVPQPVVATLRQMLTPNSSQRLYDYDELIRRFKKYANDIFSESQRTPSTKPSTPMDLDTKLKAVTAYGQENNVELWDSLSEQTPRDIPNAYTKLNSSHNPTPDSVNSQINKMLKPIILNADIIYRKSTTIVIFIAICIVIFFISMTVLDNRLDLAIIITITTIPFIGVGIMLINGVVIPEATQITSDEQYKIDVFLANVCTYNKRCNNHFDRYQHILKFGRKSFGTILDVSYKGTNISLTEFYNYTKAHAIVKNKRDKTKSIYSQDRTAIVGGYCHQEAAFTIRYKFNPPDDSSPYDLVHEVTTYTDCEHKLKPGDLIPILYYIHPKNDSEVYSTPFPIPYSDLVNYDDLIGYNLDKELHL